MTAAFTAYILAYTAACAVAAFLLFRERSSLVLFQSAYRKYLQSPWKLLTFAVASVSMVVMAPYTGDPTWDYVDASFMSVLTFLTAPWAVGTLYLAFRGRARATHVYVAVCVWMFSVSWLYDVYILLRYGYYPPTWLPNIVLSSILYFAAGLMWNLQWRDGRGVIFGFMEADWPNPAHDLAFRKVIWFALPFMILATLMIVPFLF